MQLPPPNSTGVLLLGILVLTTVGCASDDSLDLPDLPSIAAAPCGANETPTDRFCVRECPADIDPISVDLQVGCAITDIMTDAGGATIEVVIPPCGDEGVLPPGMAACVNVRLGDARSDECVTDGWLVEIEVLRADASAAGCRVEASCQRSQNVEIDCPVLPIQCGDGWCAFSEGCTDCPADCGACGAYSSCTAVAECSAPTPYCAALDLFEGSAACTTPCAEAHDCPGFAVPDSRTGCMEGGCVVHCIDDAGCPSGTTCTDLGPISPSGNVLVCMP